MGSATGPHAAPRWRPLLSLMAVLGGGLGCHKSAPPRVLGQLPDFALQSHRGTEVSREKLAGQAWVADFMFTRCGGICPAMTDRMVRLRKEVPSSVPFVSFTVDPEYDTPDVLAAYAAKTGAMGNWLFVTGSRQALYDLSIHGFKLAAMEVPTGERLSGGDGPFLHSSKFVLVDRDGRLRGYYDSSDEAAVGRLAAEIGALQKVPGP